MNRRSFLRGALGTLSATVAAVAVAKSVDAHEDAPGPVVGPYLYRPTVITGVKDGYYTKAAGPVTYVVGEINDMSPLLEEYSTKVTLERPWRIVNDPGYINYGQYGSDAESVARTGKASVFPEYDARYVIHRSKGVGGVYGNDVVDHLMEVGIIYTDSSIQYADHSIANQECAARALYVGHVAQLRG